jgi:hypothetical protein
MEHVGDYFATREQAAAENQAWSRERLGQSFNALNLGCILLDRASLEVQDCIQSRELSKAERGIARLMYWIDTRATSACHLLISGFPTDAGALFRGALEGYGLQCLFERAPTTADEWFDNKQIPEKAIFRAVDKAFHLGKAWGDMAKVVHPNYIAVFNQTDRMGESRPDAGVRNETALQGLSRQFVILVGNELHLVGRALGVDWSTGLRDVIESFNHLLPGFGLPVSRRS